MTTIDPALATIGIVTALPKECAAMLAMLEGEEPWTPPGRDGGAGGVKYYLGRIPVVVGERVAGEHVVVVALMPDMGNNAAAVCAMRLLGHCPSVDHVIMCGIAGGVPQPGDGERDVRLGDVVVSDRNGVVQYDLVKERPDGSKEHRHPPRAPGEALLSAVGRLKMEDVRRKRPWEAWLVRGDALEDAARPADGVDAKGEPISYPPDTKRRTGVPRVFHGTVAAANTLLKNPAHRDYLGEKFGVKAVEMESSGIADATWANRAGYLVVRGICDYCDERKGDVWQGAAAVAAAAYTRAVVAEMPLVPGSQPGGQARGGAGGGASGDATRSSSSDSQAADGPRAAEHDERARRGEAAKAAMIDWLTGKLRGAPTAATLLADRLVAGVKSARGGGAPTRADELRARLADAGKTDRLPAVLAAELLAVSALVAAAAINGAHEAAVGNDREVLGEILRRALPYAADLHAARQLAADAIERGETAIELPFRTEALAELICASVDEVEVDLVPHPVRPVGREAMRLPSSTFVPLLHAKDELGPKQDFIDQVVLAVLRHDGRDREKFAAVLDSYDGREDRRKWTQTLLDHLAQRTKRARYLLFIDEDLRNQAPDIKGLWGLVKGLITDESSGVPGLRLVRLHGRPDTVTLEGGIVLHFGDVTERR